jgi:hypothetical protein
MLIAQLNQGVLHHLHPVANTVGHIPEMLNIRLVKIQLPLLKPVSMEKHQADVFASAEPPRAYALPPAASATSLDDFHRKVHSTQPVNKPTKIAKTQHIPAKFVSRDSRSRLVSR